MEKIVPIFYGTAEDGDDFGAFGNSDKLLHSEILMPRYEFECKKCEKQYSEITPFSEYDKKFPDVACPHCKSKRKSMLMAKGWGIGGTTKSKMENFDYRAKTLMEKAKGERRTAEAGSHMGTDVYNPIDDVSSGLYEGEVK